MSEGKQYSLQDITNITNIPKFTVYDIKQCETSESKERIKCLKKLSPRTMQQILHFIRTNKTTRRFTLTQLKKIFQLKVHENTIQRSLNDAGYKHRIARWYVFLNKRDRKQRLKFAKEHLH